MIDKSILPSHWEVKKLGEVCKAVTGNTPSKGNIANYGNYIPFVKPPQINDRKISDAPEKLSLEGSQKARILPVGSVLVTCIGNLGRTAINKTPVAFNQQINALIPSEILDGNFLFYQAQSINFRNQLENLAAATTVAIVNKGKFETIEIVIPPLPEQQEIVAKIEELFSELDKGKEQLETTLKQLKVYRQAVLKWAFEGRFTNAEVRDGELPEGWLNSSIGEIFEVFVGSTPSRKIDSYWNGNINWVSSGEVAFCNINETKQKITEEGLNKSSCKLHPPGTVIIAMIGEGKTRGQAAILKVEATHNQNTAAIRVDQDKYLSKLLYYFLVWKYEDNRRVGSGNNQKALNKERVKSIPIPLIPLVEQHHLVQEIESRLSVCDKVEETITKGMQQAETLRQSILKQAFEGKLVKTASAKVTQQVNQLKKKFAQTDQYQISFGQ
ncbi:restriction endonuclease subunit S [uncultured Pontibacter sp.]|uniref:restriction endonuclease subunit S n=1 Tax=uncultured Pontibacter sp. TaxID=453356 RepID=UPI002621291A|nr:restriction endonuclease subunit S [uncultured Pontibacter sp.]